MRPGYPTFPHSQKTETRDPEAVRAYRSVQESRAGDQGQGGPQDLQVNPAAKPGCADHQHQPDAAGVGELLPSRSIQTRVQPPRPSRLVADCRLDAPVNTTP